MTKKISYLAPIFLLVAFLLDGQYMFFISNLLPGSFSVMSYSLFIIGLFLTVYLSLPYCLFLFFLIGILYDTYYFGILGIATTIFPLLMYFIYFFYQNLRFRFLTNFIILLVVIFLLESLSFGLARIFKLTDLSFYLFIFYQLLPTLLFNLLLLMAEYPLINRLFKNINKT